MSKERLSQSDDYHRVQLEVKCMMDVRHGHVIRLLQVSQDVKFFYLVMEVAEGGDMLDYLEKYRHYSDHLARNAFRQILAAVAFCHDRGYVLRDLKPENILLDGAGSIRLIDFGLVSRVSPVLWQGSWAGHCGCQRQRWRFGMEPNPSHAHALLL